MPRGVAAARRPSGATASAVTPDASAPSGSARHSPLAGDKLTAPDGEPAHTRPAWSTARLVTPAGAPAAGGPLPGPDAPSGPDAAPDAACPGGPRPGC